MKETVEQVKADLVARGEDLSGPCGAFKITRRVAWALRDSGAGLLSKPSGNNCEGYATDVICYPDGRTFDCLIDGGGQNGPTWEQHQPHDPAVAARYRPAIDPGDGPKPEPEPDPEPEPKPQPVDLSALVAQLQHIASRVDDIRAELVLTKAIAKAIHDKPDPVITWPPFPAYETPIRFIGTVTSTPKG
jgi:hypothetical protein